MLIALTAIILLGVPLGFVLDRLAREATISRLERSAAHRRRRRTDRLRRQAAQPGAVGPAHASGRRTVLHLADGGRIEAGDPPAEPSLSVETDAGAGAVVEPTSPPLPR